MRITKWPLVAGAALSVGIGFLAVGAPASTDNSEPQTGIYRSLRDEGRRLWHFEALLRREFPGRRAVFVSGPGLNFSCVGHGCNPHARYRVWSYTFRAPRSAAYHVSHMTLKGVVFGNFVMVVRLRGRAVACDVEEQRFLVAWSDTVKRELDCLPRPT